MVRDPPIRSVRHMRSTNFGDVIRVGNLWDRSSALNSADPNYLKGGTQWSVGLILHPGFCRPRLQPVPLQQRSSSSYRRNLARNTSAFILIESLLISKTLKIKRSKRSKSR